MCYTNKTMNDQSQPTHQSTESSDCTPRTQITEPISTAPQQPSTEQDLSKTEQKLAKVERDMSGFERSTLRWTRATFIILAVTCLFIGYQGYEIRTGSSDTHALAEQAKRQADKMTNVSDAATQIQQAAHDMVTQEQKIADDSEKSLSASNTQNRLGLNNTIEEFRLEHRAWVSLNEIVFVKLNPGGKGAPVQVYEMHVGDKIAVNLDYKNTGSTPAFNVRPVARLDSFPAGPPVFKPLPHESTGYGLLQPGEGVFDSMDFDSLTQDNVNAFNLGIVRIYGRIDYRDAFDVDHWATFCRWILSGGAQAGCPEQPDKTDTNPN